MLPSIHLDVRDGTEDNLGKVLLDRLKKSVYRNWEVDFEGNPSQMQAFLIEEDDDVKYIICLMVDCGTNLGTYTEVMKRWTAGLH